MRLLPGTGTTELTGAIFIFLLVFSSGMIAGEEGEVKFLSVAILVIVLCVLEFELYDYRKLSEGETMMQQQEALDGVIQQYRQTAAPKRSSFIENCRPLCAPVEMDREVVPKWFKDCPSSVGTATSKPHLGYLAADVCVFPQEKVLYVCFSDNGEACTKWGMRTTFEEYGRAAR